MGQGKRLSFVSANFTKLSSDRSRSYPEVPALDVDQQDPAIPESNKTIAKLSTSTKTIQMAIS